MRAERVRRTVVRLSCFGALGWALRLEIPGWSLAQGTRYNLRIYKLGLRPSWRRMCAQFAYQANYWSWEISTARQ